MQPEQIKKIIKASDAISTEVLHNTDKKSFKSSFLRISAKVKEDKDLAPPLKFLDVLEAFPGANERNFVSKGHMQLLQQLNVRLNNYPLQHGEPNIECWRFEIAEGRLQEKVPVPFDEIIQKLK